MGGGAGFFSNGNAGNSSSSRWGELAASSESTYPGPNGEILVTADSGKFGASETYSRINKAQWEDYKKRFGPIEQKLMDYVTSPHFLNEEVSRATTVTAGAFDRGKEEAFRNMHELGATLNSDQTGALERKFKFSKNLAVTDASNIARMQGKERRMTAMAGGTNSFTNLRGSEEQNV